MWLRNFLLLLPFEYQQFLKNPKNLGAYQNKLSLIKASKNEYIYILDSENIAGKNFDKIVKEHVLVEKRKDIIFQPNIMHQFWRYPKTSKILGSFIKKYRVKFFNNDTLLNIPQKIFLQIQNCEKD